MTPEHILFFRLSALGDVILAIPAIRAIRDHFPNTKLSWVTSKSLLPLLSLVNDVSLIGIDKPKSLKQWWQNGRQLSLISADVLLAAQASARSHAMYPFIRCKRKIGFDSQRSKDLHKWFVDEQIEYRNEHLLEGFLGFCRALDVPFEKPTSPTSWALNIPAHYQKNAQSLLAPLQEQSSKIIAINPCTSKEERNWPLGNFVELANNLLANDACLVITGGSSQLELDAAAKLAEKLPNDRYINLCGRTDLLTSAAVLQASSLLISPDTGPAHLATALGTPVVGLYAVARPELTGPYLYQQFVVNAYPEACERFLGKSADQCGWHQRVHDHRAMSLITTEMALNAVEKALNYCS